MTVMASEQKRERQARNKRGVRVKHQDLSVEHFEPSIEERSTPASDETPREVYVRRRPMSCPRCSLTRLPTGNQAISVRSIVRDVAYLRCRSCGYQWSLPVVDH